MGSFFTVSCFSIITEFGFVGSLIPSFLLFLVSKVDCFFLKALENSQPNPFVPKFPSMPVFAPVPVLDCWL